MKKSYIRNCKVREFENNIKEIFDTREGVVMDSYIGSLLRKPSRRACRNCNKLHP